MKTRRRDPLGRKNNYPLWARCCLLKRQNALVGGDARDPSPLVSPPDICSAG